jgi:isopentenyl phosphate kinase
VEEKGTGASAIHSGGSLGHPQATETDEVGNGDVYAEVGEGDYTEKEQEVVDKNVAGHWLCGGKERRR